MNQIKLNAEDAHSLCMDDHEDFEVVAAEEWTQDYKYQTCSVVYKHLPSGDFYQAHWSRSGSYHTDWYYTHEGVGVTLHKVKQTVKVIETVIWELDNQ
jgi:uncharacterized protein (UPF0248 family)